MRRVADEVMRLLARLLVRVFFRRIELEGADHLPKDAPVVLVANHLNGLVDGLLLIATLGRYPRFLGKSTLFRILPLWPFLKLAGVIPVHRAVDGEAGGQNASAFSTCRQILARRGLVAIFPEGISHNEPSLQPLRTGAARIALEAGIDGGVPGVVTVAVGLTYDAKARFRSRALVRVAEPVGIDRWEALYRTGSHQAVRQFTDDVAAQLREVSPEFTSWSHAEELAAIAEVIVRTPGGQLPEEVRLSDQVELAEQLGAAEHRGDRMVEMEVLSASFATYERDLKLLGLSDAQVVARYPTGKLRLSLAWALLKVLASLPLAAVGIVAHVVPFQIVKQLAKQPTNEGIKATVKLFGCFVTFGVVYGVTGYEVGRHFGAWIGLLVAVALPVCGYATVRLGERIQRIGGLLEGYRTVGHRRAVLSTVVDHRQVVIDSARAALVPG
jgi:glycerol-3-phosphate O-acyltransferase / dihydroxyacetone phosphate acyltransferase